MQGVNQGASQEVTRADDNLHRQASFMTRRRLRKENELVQALREDISDWIAKLFPHQSIQTDNFHDVIANGTILCQLARLIEEAQAKLGQNIDKKLKIQINKMTSFGGESLMKFKARENALSFIRWCQNRGINKSVMFEPDDLVEQRDQRQVIICLMEVSRYGVRYGIQPCKLVQFEMEIDAIEKQEREKMQAPEHHQHRKHHHQLNAQVSTAQERSDQYNQGRRKLTKIRKRRSKKGPRTANRDSDQKRNQLNSLHNQQSVKGNENSNQEKVEISVIYTQTSIAEDDKLNQSNIRNTPQKKPSTEPSKDIQANKSIDLHDIFAKNMKSAFGIAASPTDHDNPIQQGQNNGHQATTQSFNKSNQPHATNSRHDSQVTPVSKHTDPVSPEPDHRSHPLRSNNDNSSKLIESTPKSNNQIPNEPNNPNVSHSNDYSKHQSFVSNAYPSVNYSYELSTNQSIQEGDEEEYWDDDEIDLQLSNLSVTKKSSRENTPEADQTPSQTTLNHSNDYPSIDIPSESNITSEDVPTSDVIDYSLLDINRERKRSTGEDSFIFDEEMMQREACIASDAVLDQYQTNQQHQQQSRLPYPIQNSITNQSRMYANKAASLDDDDDDIYSYEDEYEYEEEAENEDYYDEEEEEEEEEIVPLPSVLHKNVCKIINAARANDNIVQMKEGKYKIFDKIIFVRMLNEHVMVRVGGGWDTLEHYITLHMSLRKNKSISRSVDNVRSDIKANTSLTSYTRPKRTSVGGSVGNRDRLLHTRSSSSLHSSGSFSGFQSRLKF